MHKMISAEYTYSGFNCYFPLLICFLFFWLCMMSGADFFDVEIKQCKMKIELWHFWRMLNNFMNYTFVLAQLNNLFH